MAFSYACLVLQRVVVPAVLVLASLMRPVGISFVYLLMFFMSPFIPLATRRNFKGSVTAFFIILLALSTLVLLGHIALQILAVSTTLPIYNCSFSEQLLRHIGFMSFIDLRPMAIIEWLAPEVLVFVTSLSTYLSVKRLAAQTIAAEQLENGEIVEAVPAAAEDAAIDAATSAANGADVQATASTPLQRKRVSMISQRMHFDGLIKISPLFCLATLFFAAVLRPSVPGGFYFLIFLLAGTYWATFQTLQRGFALLLRFVMAIIVVHALCIVSYQTPWMQTHLNHTSLAARLIGLEPLIESYCASDIRVMLYNNTLTLDSYLNPFALLFAYFALALTTKHLIKPRVSLRREQRSTFNEPTETTPLVRQNTRKARTPQPLESSAGTGVVSSTAVPATSRGNVIQLDSLEQRSELENTTASILDQISYGFISVGGFIYQNSYIFTNILMMAWSIVYHSWLTFVLLLWANVLWMIPNQRKAMMRSSPFIVLYAEVLLVAQYIYGMDLNNNELPTKVSTAGINLQQIGFERPIENHMRPCVPLIVKTAFVLMFWVTSRQFFKEKRDRRRDSTLADIIAPLQITVGSAGSSYLINDGKKTSKFLKKAGDVIKNLLVRLWIWLLILVIFLCAITGEDMTGFRICYMALFLFFLLVFQSSSKAWVKIMYGFWLFLIFYAMSILILIYTYQFDKFDLYWNDYFNVSKTLQTDIGLKRYQTKDLFLHLVSPTIIVILTVIQVHYFHKRFIASLQQQPGAQQKIAAPPTETTALEPTTTTASNTQGKRRGSGGSLRRSVGGPEATDFETSVRDLVRISFRKIKNKSEYIFKNFKDVFWRFLELHIMKAVYIAGFVCSVSEVCVLHIVFVGFCVLGATSRKSVQIFISRLISFIVTIIVLSKMIYQIEYLDHSDYSVVCSDNLTANNAEWVGLSKADKQHGGLMSLLRTYIIYMVIVTLQAFISLRQLQMRVKTGTSTADIPKVLFPQIARPDAEKDLVGLAKYLLNYGFYKFGMEISLIALVSTITYRQDIVAVAYAICLIVMLLLRRSQLAKVWGVFQAFFAISILLQYIVLVGLPPKLCMVYPWDGADIAENIQRWTMLPGALHYNHVPKLIFDFIVLIILNRQKSIFCIELRFASNDDYPGGSNRSVIADIANLGRVPFDNPTHDFCSYIRNYSDILKNGVLCGFYWFTLAVVFLAGTNIADLLALGYLIGAFVFLWQGSDFYLRPIKTIISRWKWLLAFNVANILIKTSFQMAGCLFMKPLTTHCCWLVHMLGITCTSNVAKDMLLPEETEPLPTGECPKITHQIVLLWDTICFAFIIFQLRIFKSHYFCHIITDTKANNILASRGADIIESLRQKQIAHRHDHEKQVLHKIKRKMERIRATQQKLLRPLDKQTHFDEHGYPLPAPTVRRRKEIKLHPHATRAGDYYMFEEMDDKFELDLIHDEIDFLEEENLTESEMKMQRRKTLYDKSKDAPVDFPSTSRGISKEKDEAMAAATSAAPAREDVPVIPPQLQAASVVREATSKETSDSRSKMEVDSGEVTAKDSDEDFDTNPIIRLLEGFLVTLTIRLNRFSRNYRFVNRILATEKKTLKESSSLNRLGLSSAAAMFHFLKSNLESDENGGQPASSSTPRRQTAATPTNNFTNEYTTPITTTTTTNTTTTPLSPQEPPPPTTTTTTTSTLPIAQPPHAIEDIIEIPVDTVDAATSRKQSINSSPPVKGAGEFNLEEENFAQRDHHIIVEVLISSWYALLANTDLICYIVVFINQVVNASLISLPLPIMVFLWGTLSLPRPTKTFWVTLIAYTQAIVLIKCIFQFKLIWAHYSSSLPNQPLSAAKVFGVEMKTHYAVYDLILLLVLFLHRYLLKSQGLWKSGYKDVPDMQLKPTASIDEREDSDNLSNQDSRQMNERDDVGQKMSLQVSQASLPGSPEYSKSGINQLKRTKYTSSLHKFFFSLVHKSRLATDVYALMFLCDFVNFFVLLFGFTAFGTQQTESDGGVQTYLAENKVPVPFLIMLLVQFLLIVIDRSLYLRKALVNKIIFHFFSVIGIHIWMFFVVPAVTERTFNSLAPPIIFYVIKCFYMLLSSYQIKSGYPKRILGNFFTKGFSLVNMIAFKVYMQIPFLYELRTILDWVCIDSTMTLFDWLKMEDIFSNIYLIRCTRQIETDFPAMRAQKKAAVSKLLMGGTVVFLIVICIWGPLCLFALGNAVGTSNVPHQVSLSIRIGPYDPIYTTNNYDSIYEIDSKRYADMTNAYLKDKQAVTFITGYDATDVAAVKLAGNSPSLWNIAPPDRLRLLNDLKNNHTLKARFSYSLTRKAPAKGLKETVGDEHIIELDDAFEGRAALIHMLNESHYDNGTAPATEVVLPNMIPKFIKVLNSGDANVVSVLGEKQQDRRPLVIKIHRDKETNGLWWEIRDFCNDTFYTNYLSKFAYSNCTSGIVMYTFNDKKFPSTFSFLTAGGIIGLYTTFVLLASRFMKSFIGGQNRKIMFEDLPYVDRVLQLCLDIYLVREALEFALEEDLFAKLLFLYRSPETLIKWTRPKEEYVDDDGDTDSIPSRMSVRRHEQQQQQQQPQ
ncbi:piezo-type mechanosensitive ion channel component isoform X3 [Scaptodrosophila lebanonensis]|uniref:Piezo-type mechanosensitive ion channel component isoform X3 n=1 Tax=Drosophila lebanonensis TaxID=7225 RepID=A0A6J2UBK6_DROLE|nr:piezo-type mechanosensitive ion channel component isoform X3 [Scaptodrosophila lebanonensis]